MADMAMNKTSFFF